MSITVTQLLSSHGITIHKNMSIPQLISAFNSIPAPVKALLPAGVGVAITTLGTAYSKYQQARKLYQTASQTYQKAQQATITAAATLTGNPITAPLAAQTTAQTATSAAASAISTAVSTAKTQLLNTPIPGT